MGLALCGVFFFLGLATLLLPPLLFLPTGGMVLVCLIVHVRLAGGGGVDGVSGLGRLRTFASLASGRGR